MKPISIDPNQIKAQVSGKSGMGSVKAAFSDVLDGISDMGPAVAELVGQWSGGSTNASAVLNAAFSGIAVTSDGMRASYGGYGTYPGMMGSPRYATTSPFVAGRYAGYGSYGTTPAGTTGVDDPSQYTHEIMASMNQNNLKLLELQALLQSNMQVTSTQSAILKADHETRINMIRNLRLA